jgi:hypothetical protein
MSTELARVAVEDPIAVGRTLHASGLFPDVKKYEQAVVKVLAGREFGVGPVASMTGIHVIDGKPSLGANLLAGLVKSSGRYDYEVKARTDEGCTLEFFKVARVPASDKYPSGEVMRSMGTISFDKKDATRAGLLGKGNWRKYPRDMYFARALTAGVRTFCPDLLNGAPAYTPEELSAPDVIVDASLEVDREYAAEAPAEVKPPKAKTKPKATVSGPVEPEPEVISDAVVVTDPVPADAPQVPDGGPSIDVIRDAFKVSGWSADKMRWTLVELGVEDATDVKAAIAALSLDQGVALLERLTAGAS